MARSPLSVSEAKAYRKENKPRADSAEAQGCPDRAASGLCHLLTHEVVVRGSGADTAIDGRCLVSHVSFRSVLR